jgi:hypothetical protein
MAKAPEVASEAQPRLNRNRRQMDATVRARRGNMYLHVTPAADSRGGVTLRDVTPIPRCWRFLEMEDEKRGK